MMDPGGEVFSAKSSGNLSAREGSVSCSSFHISDMKTHNLPKTFYCIFPLCILSLMYIIPVSHCLFFLLSVGRTVEVIPEVAHIIAVGDPGLLMC